MIKNTEQKRNKKEISQTDKAYLYKTYSWYYT